VDLATFISFGSHVSAADTLLIKASATVTVYRGHRRTLLPALFIMCIAITRNNSLLGGRAWAEARTPASQRVTLYCTLRPSALTTRPHGQVGATVYISRFTAVYARQTLHNTRFITVNFKHLTL